jgi:hypothetical protein
MRQAINRKNRAMIYGPKTDGILAGVLSVASGGWIILILLGYLESLGWGRVLGLFVLFGIGVASLFTQIWSPASSAAARVLRAAMPPRRREA